MDSLVEFLAYQPLLVFFFVIGAGYFLGSISVFRFSLGPAAVLFAGIAIGDIDPRLRIPEVIPALGLILFVYTTGLQSGSTFFNSSGERAIRANFVALGVLCIGVVLVRRSGRFVEYQSAADRRRVYRIIDQHSGAGNSIEAIRKVTLGFDDAKQWLNAPVIGYGVSYPFGVIGVLLGFYIFERLMSGQSSTAAEVAEEPAGDLIARSYRVTNPNAVDVPVKKLVVGIGAVLSRMKRGATLSLDDGKISMR